MVLDATKIADATAQICEENSIPSPRSVNYIPSPSPIAREASTTTTGTPGGGIAKEDPETTAATTSAAKLEEKLAAAVTALQPVPDLRDGVGPESAAAERELSLAKGARPSSSGTGSDRVGRGLLARFTGGKAVAAATATRRQDDGKPARHGSSLKRASVRLRGFGPGKNLRRLLTHEGDMFS